MELYDRLNQLTATVRSAKTMPMSASCLVNRAEMLEILERLRDELPTTLDHADALLSDREAVIAAAREQAERILEGARVEREQLIGQADVLVAARVRAATLTAEAVAESSRLLADADDYVDRKLADFEALLGQVAAQVNNGRLRLTARRGDDPAALQGTQPGPGGGNHGRADVTPESGPPAHSAVVGQQSPATAGASLRAG